MRASRPTSCTAAPCSRKRCDASSCRHVSRLRCHRGSRALWCLHDNLTFDCTVQGIVTVPGSGFQQADGTYHFRCAATVSFA